MDDDVRMVLIPLVGLISFVILVALLFAQLRLFSIDRTLKEILDELRAARELDAARSVSAAAPHQAGVPRSLG